MPTKEYSSINIDDLTYGQLKQIAAQFGGTAAAAATSSHPSQLLGQRVVVRTYSAGVHIGILLAKDGENVLLKDSRRLWKWAGAFTLSEVARFGIKKTDSRMACSVPLIELTNANEIIPTSEKARASFEHVHES